MSGHNKWSKIKHKKDGGKILASLIDKLEDNDDIQEIFTSADNINSSE